jgi:hypothetical protein
MAPFHVQPTLSSSASRTLLLTEFHTGSGKSFSANILADALRIAF